MKATWQRSDATEEEDEGHFHGQQHLKASSFVGNKPTDRCETVTRGYRDHGNHCTRRTVRFPPPRDVTGLSVTLPGSEGFKVAFLLLSLRFSAVAD